MPSVIVVLIAAGNFYLTNYVIDKPYIITVHFTTCSHYNKNTNQSRVAEESKEL